MYSSYRKAKKCLFTASCLWYLAFSTSDIATCNLMNDAFFTRTNFPIIIKFHNYFILCYIRMLILNTCKGKLTQGKTSSWFFFFFAFQLSTYKKCNKWVNSTYFDESNVKHTKHCIFQEKKKNLHLFLTHNIRNEIPNIVKDRL